MYAAEAHPASPEPSPATRRAPRRVFGRSRALDISVNGKRVQVTDDGYSDRVRCDHPAVRDGRALGRGLNAAAELIGRDRVVVLTTPAVAEGLAQTGYEVEATIPGFYEGEEDCVVMGLARTPAREGPSFPRENREALEVLEDKGLDGDNIELPPPDDVSTRLAEPEDAPALARLLGRTFEHYPTPSNDPAYLAEQIKTGAPFRIVEEDDRIVACASADLVPEARTAELTDCATRPEARGRGLMRRLLANLMKDLRERGYPTAFTLARARVPGVNVAFARLGFELRGTMLQSCRIGDGLEDMNVWSRAL